MAKHNDLGKQGEQMAADFLMHLGYEILERNYRYQKAEVDIIAKKKNILAIIEVKTRSTTVFGNPQDFLKAKQIERIVHAIDHYVILKQLDVEVRFDVVAIVKNGNQYDFEHLENAYFHF